MGASHAPGRGSIPRGGNIFDLVFAVGCSQLCSRFEIPDEALR